MKLRSLVPDFYSHVYVNNLYFTSNRSANLTHQNRQMIVEIYQSLTDT
jgi:hypothetical protein